MSSNGLAPDTIVELGDFQFASYEVPESISFGGEQSLAVRKRVGGTRTIDAMGRDDDDLSWSGIFVGANALDRARYLDSLRVAGLPLTLRWSELSYQVVIRKFVGKFERPYQIPYMITCAVIKDTSNPTSASAAISSDAQIRSDMSAATTAGNAINDSALSTSLSSLNTAIKSVSDFAKATQTTIAGVLSPLADAQARVKVLIASTGNTISNVTTLGGILPNTPIAQQASAFNSQLAAMTQQPVLLNLQSVLGRMGTNVSNANSSGATVTQAGGDLYRLAADAYGDPSAWTTIAKANGLTDPQLSGINTIKIPLRPDGQGGVLNA